MIGVWLLWSALSPASYLSYVNVNYRNKEQQNELAKVARQSRYRHVPFTGVAGRSRVRYRKGMNWVIDPRPLDDLMALQNGGVDAVMFSNEFGLPYLTKSDRKRLRDGKNHRSG